MNNKLFYGWVLVCIALNFFANKYVACLPIYTFTAALLAVYLFPVYPIMSVKKGERINWKKLSFLIFSYFILASVVCFSIVKLYLPENEIVNNIFSIFLLINAILALFHLFVTDNIDKWFLHAIFTAFLQALH